MSSLPLRNDAGNNVVLRSAAERSFAERRTTITTDIDVPMLTASSRMPVRVVLPYHLKNLTKTGSEITIEVPSPVTQRTILDALEETHPVLRGTIRDYATQKRRPLIRFFACQQDVSHDAVDAPLPDAVARGAEAFFIVGAIAGG